MSKPAPISHLTDLALLPSRLYAPGYQLRAVIAEDDTVVYVPLSLDDLRALQRGIAVVLAEADTPEPEGS